MYTRTFEREHYNGDYEVINLSDYGFEWFVNGELVRSGLIENIDETIALLLDEEFVEVL